MKGRREEREHRDTEPMEFTSKKNIFFCRLVFVGLAAELATRSKNVSKDNNNNNNFGPGSFKVALYDAMYNMTAQQMAEGMKVSLVAHQTD